MNTIIEKIRAEVNRLKETAKLMKLSTYKSGWNSAMNAVLQLLSTLEKECEKPIEGLEEEIDKFLNETGAPYCWCNDDEQKDWCAIIARRFYELGRQSKPKVCEGLEEEISRYLREDCSDDDEPSISEVARHFAKWGAEYRGGSETPKETIPREGPPCLI